MFDHRCSHHREQLRTPPTASGRPPADGEGDPTGSATPGGPRMPAKILVADDSATLRRIVSSVLAAQGHEVITAVDGLDAAEQVYTHAPDLVVADVQMPRMSGYV